MADLLNRLQHALADRYAVERELGREWSTATSSPRTSHLERANTPMAAFGLVIVYTALGDKDKALRWAEAAYRYRHPWAPWFGVISMFEPLWGDPRFQDLLRPLNLPARKT